MTHNVSNQTRVMEWLRTESDCEKVARPIVFYTSEQQQIMNTNEPQDF